MRMTSPAAASALVALYANDRVLMERSFDHLTGDTLLTLDKQLLMEYNKLNISGVQYQEKEDSCNLILAQAYIRRKVHRCLDKYTKLQSSKQVVEDALKYHTLPLHLQEKLAAKYGNNSQQPITNWYEALEQLKVLAATKNGELNKGELWKLILQHPMTEYVPVQCQECGHIVPDEYPNMQQSDAEIGLKEISPSGTKELELRGGWFRGPRKAVLFEFTCCECNHVSLWYRSGHPQVILNPNKWGRLCGEQEDLRLTLADYLDISVRLVVPLDWDHVWTEYQSSEKSNCWRVEDGSARNFMCRLDEGIGSWTCVWSIHPNPKLCQDVTKDYLECQSSGGRADDGLDKNTIERYKEMIHTARMDASGGLTQAKTVNGYLLARAKFDDDMITKVLQQAARDYGTQEWWQLTHR